MTGLDRLFLYTARLDRWQLLKLTLDGSPAERRMARLCLIMYDADKGDISFRTAKNKKVYAINEKTEKIASGPMKGIKVSRSGHTAASKVGAKKEYAKPEHPIPGTRTSEPPLDKKGKPFRYCRLNLQHQEYGQIMHEITTNYGKYKGKEIIMHTTYIENGDDAGYHVYMVENHGKDDYNIYERD